MTAKQVRDIIYDALRDNCDSTDIKETDKLIHDLGMDSIDTLETGLTIERELLNLSGRDFALNIEDHLSASSTVEDLVNYVLSKVEPYITY